ncbi:MAG: pectate lyase family protein [Planctomycetota bacterium]|jgi:hypothetical protein
MAAFACTAFVRESSTPERLIPVVQGAAAVTIADATPTWLAIHYDLDTVPAGWTRQAPTHYIYISQATQPADPDGAMVFAKVTVAGSVITVINLAGPTNPHGTVNVRDPANGALGDATTDDQAAFALAVRRLSINGGIMYIPCGTYVTNSANPLISITDINYIHIMGEGGGCVTLQQNGAGDGINMFGDPAGANEIVFPRVTGVTLQGNDAGAVGIHYKNSKDGWFSDFSVAGFLSHGVQISGTQTVKMQIHNGRITAGAGGTNTDELLNAASTGNGLRVTDVYFNTGVDATVSRKIICADVATFANVVFYSNVFDGCDTGVNAQGQFTSIAEYYDTSSGAGLALTTSVKQNSNAGTVIVNPFNAKLCNNDGTTGNIDISALSDKRYATVISSDFEGAWRGVFNGAGTHHAFFPSTITLSGDMSDYSPGTCSWAYDSWKIDPNGADRTVNSIQFGVSGRELTLFNVAAVGSGEDLIIAHEGTGTAANKIQTPYGAPITIRPFQRITLRYDDTLSRWRAQEVPRTTVTGAFSLNLAAPGASPGCVDSAGQTVTGAALGDICTVSMSVNMQTGQQMTCHISAADTVIFRVCDFDGAATDPDGAGTTYTAIVTKGS